MLTDNQWGLVAFIKGSFTWYLSLIWVWKLLIKKKNNSFKTKIYIDGSVQDSSNSIANTLELLQSCINPSISLFVTALELPICLICFSLISILFDVSLWSLSALMTSPPVCSRVHLPRLQLYQTPICWPTPHKMVIANPFITTTITFIMLRTFDKAFFFFNTEPRNVPHIPMIYDQIWIIFSK